MTESSKQQSPEALRFAERLAWLGFMLFFVVVLAIYIARGIGLERDVTEANRELLDTQLRLAQYTRHEVPRPLDLGLTHQQLQGLQRRGMARPEIQLRRSLLEQDPELFGQISPVQIDPDGIHILNGRWVLAHFSTEDARHGQMLLGYEVIHGNVQWQPIEFVVE